MENKRILILMLFWLILAQSVGHDQKVSTIGHITLTLTGMNNCPHYFGCPLCVTLLYVLVVLILIFFIGKGKIH